MPYKQQNKCHFDSNKTITISLGHIKIHKKSLKIKWAAQCCCSTQDDTHLSLVYIWFVLTAMHTARFALLW